VLSPANHFRVFSGKPSSKLDGYHIPRASTGAPTSQTDDTVALLPGVGALAEPAKLVGVDATQSVAEASPSATTTPLAPVEKAATISTQDIIDDDSSQPPPDPPANTARTRTVHFDDLTDEEDAPAAGGAPDDPDDDNSDDKDDYDDDEEDDKDWTAIYVMEHQADLADYVVTEADRRLNRVYGEHPHSNVGKHLSGGIERDALWQARWLEVMQLTTMTYSVPTARPCGLQH
jgi:hypothetical protein